LWLLAVPRSTQHSHLHNQSSLIIIVIGFSVVLLAVVFLVTAALAAMVFSSTPAIPQPSFPRCL
jgi:hypothetical protein